MESPDPIPSIASPPPPPLPEAVRAWLVSRPRLRPLSFTCQRLGGRTAFVLEDPGTSAFYRLGEREYRFVEQLDGRRTVAEILQRSASLPEPGLDAGNALRLLEMLRAERLLDEPGRPMEPAPGTARTGLLDRLGSILFLRVSLGQPDRFFIRLSGWMGWLVHPVAWLLGLAAIVVGGLVLVRHADRMRDATLNVFTADRWVWTLVIFVALRAIHEVWHGLTCRRWGGSVRDIGVFFIVFFPVGYTDVTSSWGLPSRWHRLLVSCAGPFIELVLAGTAAIVWAQTGPGVANTVAWQVVVTAGASSLLVNINPLMRFDGYYILTDLLDLPNLYARGQIVMRAFFRRCILGVRGQGIPGVGERGWRAAVLYGPAAFAWRIFAVTNILFAAMVMFRGAGIAIVCVSLLAWSGRSAGPFLRWFGGLPVGVQAAAAVRLLLAAGLGGAVLLLPWRPATVEPAIVDWADRCDIYSGCPGILESVRVRPGGAVSAGEVLAQIDNSDLQAAADRLKIRAEREELRAAVALREDDMPAWSAARAAARALEGEWKFAAERARRRAVSAPVAGIVHEHRLEERLGEYLREGEALLTLGHAVDREMVALVPHERMAFYNLKLGDEVEVRILGRAELLRGPVSSIGPAARQQIDYPALTAFGGGHLAVKPRAGGGRDGYELQDPQFEVHVRLTGPGVDTLHAGERGYVRTFGGVPIPIWRMAVGKIGGFWSRLMSKQARDFSWWGE